MDLCGEKCSLGKATLKHKMNWKKSIKLHTKSEMEAALSLCKKEKKKAHKLKMDGGTIVLWRKRDTM